MINIKKLEKEIQNLFQKIENEKQNALSHMRDGVQEFEEISMCDLEVSYIDFLNDIYETVQIGDNFKEYASNVVKQMDSALYEQGLSEYLDNENSKINDLNLEELNDYFDKKGYFRDLFDIFDKLSELKYDLDNTEQVEILNNFNDYVNTFNDIKKDLDNI